MCRNVVYYGVVYPTTIYLLFKNILSNFNSVIINQLGLNNKVRHSALTQIRVFTNLINQSYACISVSGSGYLTDRANLYLLRY